MIHLYGIPNCDTVKKCAYGSTREGLITRSTTTRRKALTFVIAAVLAGISGLLYVQWGNDITPTQVGLLQAALPVIWVAVGGRDKLLAVVIATYALNWLNYTLASQGNQYALVIIGVLLVVVMTFFPRGMIVTTAEWFRDRRRRPA